MSRDEDRTEHRDEESPGEEPPGNESPAEETTTDDEGADARGGGALGTVVSWIAWVIGLSLVVFGLLAMSDSGVAGLFYLVPGLVITPRTRRELKELCGIWSGR